MRKCLYPILVVGALFGIITVAMADLSDAPAPVQHFQQAGANTSPPAVSHKPIKQNSQNSNTRNQDQQAVTVLQAELSQLNQNNLLYQQKMDSEFDDLSNKNQLMQEQLQQLTQALSLLNQEVVQLKQMNEALHQVADKQASAVSSGLTPWLIDWKNKLGVSGIIIAAVIIILLLLLVFWPRRKKMTANPINKAKNTTTDEDDTKVEYDYMGSNESIPAKLNLARAYVAMEDYEAARKVLNEVAQSGSDEQQVQAAAMRKLLPAES